MRNAPRYFILVLLASLLPIRSFCQEQAQLVADACRCLEGVLKVKENRESKIAFFPTTDECFAEIYKKTLTMGDRADTYARDFFKGLADGCDSYRDFHQVADRMTLEKSRSKIDNTALCKKVMRVGEFEEVGRAASMHISMRDSIQVMTFGKPDIFTKSKVVWKDDCSYALIIVESTNAFEATMMKKNKERLVQIVDISDNGEILVESLVHGRWYLSRLKKTKWR